MSDARRDDAHLLEAARRGEPEAVERFLQRMRCVPRILSAKNAELGRPLTRGELEDVTQETLLAVWKKLPNYDGRAKLETWVFRFCILELLKRLRGQQRARDRSGGELSAADEPIAPAEPSRLDHEDVHLGLEELDPSEADVVRMKHFEGLTLKQVSERLQVAESTIKSRYYRGIERLRLRLRQTTERGPVKEKS